MSQIKQESSSFLTSPKQRHGAFYEQLAFDYLQKQGLQIIAQNWQQPKVGELDIVGVQKGTAWDVLVFVEVRKRKVGQFGDALASVTKAKQRKLIKTARYFLQQHPHYSDVECRFDVIAFNESASKGTIDEKHCDAAIEWLQGAFVASAW